MTMCRELQMPLDKQNTQSYGLCRPQTPQKCHETGNTKAKSLESVEQQSTEPSIPEGCPKEQVKRAHLLDVWLRHTLQFKPLTGRVKRGHVIASGREVFNGDNN